MSDKTARPSDDGDESVSAGQAEPDADTSSAGVAKPAEREPDSVTGATDVASAVTERVEPSVDAASSPGADAVSGPDADAGGASDVAGSGASGGRRQKDSGERTDSGVGVPQRRGPAPRALLAGLVAAIVLLIGAVGAAGYLFVQERDKAELLAAHDEVRAAACEYAPVLANYDANNLDPYFRDVLAGASGDWKQEFETTTGELREALIAGQVVSTAGDIQCAVKTADATSAEVVVVIGQTITSLGTAGQPAPGQLAVVMRMQNTDGRWFVDQMSTPLSGAPLPPTG